MCVISDVDAGRTSITFWELRLGICLLAESRLFHSSLLDHEAASDYRFFVIGLSADASNTMYQNSSLAGIEISSVYSGESPGDDFSCAVLWSDIQMQDDKTGLGTLACWQKQLQVAGVPVWGDHPNARHAYAICTDSGPDVKSARGLPRGTALIRSNLGAGFAGQVEAFGPGTAPAQLLEARSQRPGRRGPAQECGAYFPFP